MVKVSRRGVLLTGGGAAVAAAALGVAPDRHGAAGVPPARTRSPGGPPRARGHPTSFGTVALVSSAALSLGPPGASHGAGHGAGHEHHAASSSPVASAVHGAWTDAVTVDVEVANHSRSRVELSPGQFRVRVDRVGPTVSLYSADRDPGPLDPGTTTTMRITYLAPPPGQRLTLEFADVAAPSPLQVQLGSLDRSSS